MEFHLSLVFLHVLLFVFWLGTDIGVFLAAKISERSDLGVETRATVMQLGMLLDRLPRSCLTLIVPTGLQLAVNTGQLGVRGIILPLVWVICLAWLLILWLGFLRPETTTEKRATQFNFTMHVIMAILLLSSGMYLLANAEAPRWLSIKILLVGLIMVTGVALDSMFKPAVTAFVTIISQGATKERDSVYSNAIRPVYKAVLAIYLFVVIAAYLGVTKPYF